jgi:trans-aconitate methyltransferase
VGISIFGRIEVLFDILSGMYFKRLIDVGCGDGRVLRELSEKYPSVEMIGVNYSGRAIELADALNPNLDFRATDIHNVNFESKFDMQLLSRY